RETQLAVARQIHVPLRADGVLVLRRLRQVAVERDAHRTRGQLGVLGVDVARGQVERKAAANDGLHLELRALELGITTTPRDRRRAFLDLQLDAVVVRPE